MPLTSDPFQTALFGAAEQLKTQFPILIGLGFAPEELVALSRQGFLRAEDHGQQIRHKLRFRICGCQRARCVPADLVEGARTELDQLQAHRRLARILRNHVREGRRVLRQTKCDVSAAAAELGLKFHGRILRRVKK